MLNRRRLFLLPMAAYTAVLDQLDLYLPLALAKAAALR